MEENFCTGCGECCKSIKVNFEEKILYFDGIQALDDNFKKMLTETSKEGTISYCRCKYLDNNRCTNTNKPEICKQYPSSPFAFIPEICGYSGKIFMDIEQIKQKVRKYKEEIIHYTALISTMNNKKENQQIEKIIHSHQKFIDKYKEYGSHDW